jgi:hypothetical protein
VLLKSVSAPTAVFESPSVLEPSAPEPTAVLKLAVPLPLESLLKSEKFAHGSVTKAVNIAQKTIPRFRLNCQEGRQLLSAHANKSLSVPAIRFTNQMFALTITLTSGVNHNSIC